MGSSTRTPTPTRTAAPPTLADEAPPADVAADVRALVADVFSYDHRTVAAHARSVLPRLDPPFASEYARTTGDVVARTAAATGADVKAAVTGLGVMAREGERVTYLAFLDQTSSSKAKPSPTVTQSVVEVVVVDHGGPQGRHLADVTAGPSTQLASSSVLRLPLAEAAGLVSQLESLSGDDVEAGIATVLHDASGEFAAQFRKASTDLPRLLRSRHTRSQVTGVVAALVAVDGQDATFLVSAQRTVTDTTSSTPTVSHDRWRVVVTTEGGRGTVSRLDAVP